MSAARLVLGIVVGLAVFGALLGTWLSLAPLVRPSVPSPTAAPSPNKRILLTMSEPPEFHAAIAALRATPAYRDYLKKCRRACAIIKAAGGASDRYKVPGLDAAYVEQVDACCVLRDQPEYKALYKWVKSALSVAESMKNEDLRNE